MFFRLRRTLNLTWFDFRCRGIRSAPPARIVPGAPLRVVTMASHRDVTMYLVAIKTFCRRIDVGAVTLLSDNSITPADRELLARHVPGIEIREVREIDTGRCPKGGCWERLALIAERCRDGYVVQLDSDTITLDRMPEVEALIAEGRAFTMLGDDAEERVETFAEAGARARAKLASSQHVQAIAERGMADVPDADRRLYIRGNAAFAGFPRGSFDLATMEAITDLMREVCGAAAWDRWGSEQVASNLVVAGCGGGFLPASRYCGHYPSRGVDYEKEAALVHFIGAHRFENGFFAALARKDVARMRREAVA